MDAKREEFAQWLDDRWPIKGFQMPTRKAAISDTVDAAAAIFSRHGDDATPSIPVSQIVAVLREWHDHPRHSALIKCIAESLGDDVREALQKDAE